MSPLAASVSWPDVNSHLCSFLPKHSKSHGPQSSNPALRHPLSWSNASLCVVHQAEPSKPPGWGRKGVFIKAPTGRHGNGQVDTMALRMFVCSWRPPQTLLGLASRPGPPEQKWPWPPSSVASQLKALKLLLGRGPPLWRGLPLWRGERPPNPGRGRLWLQAPRLWRFSGCSGSQK